MIAVLIFFLLAFKLYALNYKDILEILKRNPFSPKRFYEDEKINDVKSQNLIGKKRLKKENMFRNILGVVKNKRNKYLFIKKDNKIIKLKEGDILFGKYKILLIAKDKVVLLKTDNNEEVIISFKREKNGNKDFNKRK